nr:unnamed protein product [Digitaria exilis]
MARPPPQTLPLLLLLLPLLASLAPASTAATFSGLDAFLASAAARDPSAGNDTFAALPAGLRRALSVPTPLLPSRLLSLTAAVPVHVRLAGNSFPASSGRSLPSLVNAAVSSANFLSSRRPHRLAVSHTLHLDVTGPVAASKLANSASDAVRAHLEKSPAPFHTNALAGVPYSLVDDLVAEDYRAISGSGPAEAVYIYLLDLGQQPRQYAYTAAASGTDSSSPGYSRCLGPMWTGKDRYIWIDLGAGPVNYGPALSGDGVLPRGEFHPLATLHGRPKSEKALLADLASLVLSAYKSLLVPSLRTPVHYEDSLLIRFVHIHGYRKEPEGLDFGVIEQSIRDGDLPYSGQSLKFELHTVRYHQTVAFGDMVVAVRTRSSQTVSDYT